MLSLDEKLTSAEFYAGELGWRLVPFTVNRSADGKKQVVGISRWQKLATTDVETLREWFADSNRHIGLLLGPHSGVIDIEADGDRGKAALAERMADIRTPHFQSTNSPHFLFRWIPEFEPTHAVTIDVDGLECRIGRKDVDGSPVGCQSLLPPTDNRQWVIDPRDCPLADPPEWLVELIVSKFLIRRPPRVYVRPPGVTDVEVQQSAQAYALAAPPAVEGYEGDRQTWLVTLATVNGYDLSDDEALEVMRIYSSRCRPPWSDKQLRHKINSARRLQMDRGFQLEWEFGEGIRQEQDPPAGVLSTRMFREQLGRSPGKNTINVDRSPTGLGKSFADGQAIKTLGVRSLTVLPTHVNCREIRESYRLDHDLQAVCFPEITESNCQRIREVEQARSHGISAQQVLCPKCIYAEEGSCTYQKQAKAAKKAEHLVCTHKRLELTAPDVTENRGYIAVHENIDETLIPMRVLTDKRLEKMHRLLINMVDRLSNQVSDRMGVQDFARELIRAIEYLQTLLAGHDETWIPEEPFPVRVEDPPLNFLQSLWACRRGRERLNQECLSAVRSLVIGSHRRWVVSVSAVRGRLDKQIVVVLRMHLPTKRIWVLSDATGSMEVINATLAGDRRTPVDITPKGLPRQEKRIIQYVSNESPAGLTRRQTAEVAAGYLQAVCRRIPDHYRRIGVIGHSIHIREMFKEGSTLLTEAVRQRVGKWCYFGQGADRASNEWTTACDVLVLLGVPRVSESVIRNELIRIDDLDSARLTPGWGKASWRGVATDGYPLLVESRAYDHPAWRDTYDRVVTAALIQAVGRARVFLPGGIDVIVASNELIRGFNVEVVEHSKPNGLLERAMELIRASDDGMVVTELAVELCCSVRQIRRLLVNESLREPRLRQRKDRWIWSETEEEQVDRVEQLKQALNETSEGLKTKEVAELWNVTVRHALRLLKEIEQAVTTSGRWTWIQKRT